MPLVVFPSSAAVYGNPPVLPVPEDSAIAPISPYGFHKAACELLAKEYSECFGLDIVVCRFFSLFGVGQQRLLVWELYEQLAGSNSTIWLEGTGTESRDYLEISDAASALFHVVTNRLAARNQESHNGGQTFIVNIGSGEETNVLHLAVELRNLVAPEKQISCRGIQRRGAPQRWCADVRRLRSLIPEWQPKILSKSLSECVASWQKCHRVA
jgi:nucleoside-diphosphate-sugar epimerase